MASRANLAKIHIAKKELNLEDEIYRDILHTQFTKTSSRDLNDFQAVKLLQHFQALGWDQGNGKKKSHGRRPANIDRGDRAAQLQKIEALLTIGKLPWGYADAIARQMRLADKVEWVGTTDLYRVIAALTYKAKKEGWDLQ